MSTGFTTRRRAERFEALLADPAAGSDDPRFGELLTLVGELQAVPAPRPRPGFTAALREQLMIEAESALLPQDHRADDRLRVPARAPRTARSPRDRRLAVAAGALTIVGATTSMAVAAQTALPGDTLYPVKRALEDAHAGISMGDAARGSTLLANASGRLDEAGELARIGSEESLAEAPDALRDFVEQAEEGSSLLLRDYRETGDAGSVAQVRDFTGRSLAALDALEGQLPEGADDELLAAARALAEIDEEAASLCATCGGLGIAEIPPSLVSAVTTDDPDAGDATLPFQPVEPGQPLQPKDPATGSGSGGQGADGTGSGGSGSGGSGSNGSGDTLLQLPDVGGVLPPGSVVGGGNGGSGPVEDLTGGLLGQGGGSGGAGDGSEELLKPLEETGKKVDDLLDGATGGKKQGKKGGKQGGGSGSGSLDDTLDGLLGN